MRNNFLTKLLIGIFLIIAATAGAQSNNIRGFYVRDCTSWLGNTSEENRILSYAQSNGFNYITLYGLGSMSWSSTIEKNKLATFVSKAHLQYGIDEVGAAGELYSFFSNYVIPYNNSRNYNSEKIDVLNFEFEFWVSSSISNLYCTKYLVPNGYNCDTAGAFKFAIREFRKIDSLAAAKGLVSEIYLGWPNRGQVTQIAALADRILLHAYRQDDSDLYSYSRNRLIDIASRNRSTKILPIFSSEPAFMQSYLSSNPVTKPYDAYSDDYDDETGSWKQYINLQGYQWFNYSYLPRTSSTAVATITASGSTNLTGGQSVTLTANSGSAYLWSPGGQTTRSITVSTAGTYTVRVTNSSGQNATSAPVTVTVSSTSTIPTITASGSLSICDGSYVVLTCSRANGYLWSTGETTRSIVVRNAGSYNVRAYSSAGTYQRSTSVNVTVKSAPSRPSITVNGSLTLNASNPEVQLTSSSSSSYRWSSGSGNRSITVNNGGIYKVTVTNSNGCTATSHAVTVTSSDCTPPAVPTITASGSLTINSGETVTLTSSLGEGYRWSTGEYTRSITVSTSGTYTVRVYNSGGCFATSSAKQVIVVPVRMAKPAEENESIEVIAFPNPAHEQLNVKFDVMSEIDYTFELIDMSGRKVSSSAYRSVSGENQISLDVATLPRGIYFAQLISKEERRMVKVILE